MECHPPSTCHRLCKEVEYSGPEGSQYLHTRENRRFFDDRNNQQLRIAFDFSDLQNVVLFAVYFFVLAILCIRNSNVYTNIFLEFKGYRMYECDIKCSVLNSDHEYRNSLVISKLDVTLPVNRGIEYWDFENYIYIDLRSVK